MPGTDILKELENLQINFENIIHLHNTNDILSAGKAFLGPDRFLITFPFNFKKQPDNLIRKLALINYCYGIHFVFEDKVVDDYNVSKDEFRKLIINMLNSHSLKNTAINDLLSLCGEEVYQYLFDYEKKYYQAIIFEKTVTEIHHKDMLDCNNLLHLGHKLLPVCLTYSGYCIIKGKRENIKIGEELMINYHIAKQLADDLQDIASDLHKPDLSYLLKICNSINNGKACSRAEIIDILIKENILKPYLQKIVEHISIAEEKARILNFIYFLREIVKFKKMMGNMINRINNEFPD